MKKNVANNLIYSLLLQFVNTFATVVTIPYLSRVLGPDRIGEYSYTLSVVVYFGLLGNLGSSTYGQIAISKYRDDYQAQIKCLKEIMVFRTISFSIVGMSYLVLLLIDGKNRLMFVLLLIYLMGQFTEINWFYQGKVDFQIPVVIN